MCFSKSFVRLGQNYYKFTLAQPQQVSSVKGGSMDHQGQQHKSRRMELLTEPHLGQFTYFLNWKSVLMKAADQRPKH